jgi:hypothetical protein
LTSWEWVSFSRRELFGAGAGIEAVAGVGGCWYNNNSKMYRIYFGYSKTLPENTYRPEGTLGVAGKVVSVCGGGVVVMSIVRKFAGCLGGFGKAKGHRQRLMSAGCLLGKCGKR